MAKRVIGLGCSGHGRMLAEVIGMSGEYELAGFVDTNKEFAGKKFKVFRF